MDDIGEGEKIAEMNKEVVSDAYPGGQNLGMFLYRDSYTLLDAAASKERNDDEHGAVTFQQDRNEVDDLRVATTT